MYVVLVCFNHFNTVIVAWKKRKRNGDGDRRGGGEEVIVGETERQWCSG